MSDNRLNDYARMLLSWRRSAIVSSSLQDLTRISQILNLHCLLSHSEVMRDGRL